MSNIWTSPKLKENKTTVLTPLNIVEKNSEESSFCLYHHHYGTYAFEAGLCKTSKTTAELYNKCNSFAQVQKTAIVSQEIFYGWQTPVVCKIEA